MPAKYRVVTTLSLSVELVRLTMDLFSDQSSHIDIKAPPFSSCHKRLVIEQIFVVLRYNSLLN